LRRKVFKASRLNLEWKIKLAAFLGKWFLKVSLWKAVQTCAKDGGLLGCGPFETDQSDKSYP